MQAPGNTVPGTSDRECLESWARHRDAAGLQTLVERYLAFVYSSVLRRTGDAAQAAEVTRAVFLVLARRARRLRKKTVLAGWLFQVIAVVCRKLKRIGRLRGLWQWISRKPSPALPPDAILWTRLAPQMDHALERLRTKQRNAVLLCAFVNHDFASAAKVLRTSERRVEKRVGRGMKKLAKRLGKRRAPVDSDALASACATEGCAATVPEGLALDICSRWKRAAANDHRSSWRVAQQCAFRLDKFEQAVGLNPVHPSPGERPYGPNRPIHEIKRFIDKRAESVRRQLDGTSKGMILKYPKEK